MQEHNMTENAKNELLRIARKSVKDRLEGACSVAKDPENEELSCRCGAFVSLHKKGALRGCIGVFTCDRPLYETIGNMASCAAFEDPRFPPLKKYEIDEVDFEISVLSPLRRIYDPCEVEVGAHGIYIIRRNCRGVLLPQVATQYGWDRDTFLDHTCLKACLPRNAWKDKETEIYVFTADVFGEKEVSCDQA
ncbi:MAG: AmmeMemoRadiSam system protein A [Deltaproteobacteria bacterium]|nr:AmmeMemoRadiSam system protein A [Deltaproteobacteria bacterium]